MPKWNPILCKLMKCFKKKERNCFDFERQGWACCWKSQSKLCRRLVQQPKFHSRWCHHNCPINGAKIQVHLSNLSAPIPRPTGMAFSVLRLTVVLGLCALILTSQAGKCFWSRPRNLGIVSDGWKLAQNIKGEGHFGVAERTLGWESGNTSNSESSFIKLDFGCILHLTKYMMFGMSPFLYS